MQEIDLSVTIENLEPYVVRIVDPSLNSSS
jgi:hypothetical protein